MDNKKEWKLMSGLGKATFVVDLDTAQLVQGSQKAKQEKRSLSRGLGIE